MSTAVQRDGAIVRHGAVAGLLDTHLCSFGKNEFRLARTGGSGITASAAHAPYR
jgi:hypothetical protein